MNRDVYGCIGSFYLFPIDVRYFTQTVMQFDEAFLHFVDDGHFNPVADTVKDDTQARLNNVVPGQRIHITPSATSATPAIHIQILVLVFI